MKYEYFVAVVGEEFQYVTEVDNTTKTYKCEPGKVALVMSLKGAESLLEGLIANMVPAVIVKSVKGCIMLANSK